VTVPDTRPRALRPRPAARTFADARARRIAVIASILAVPPLLVLVLRLPLINQLDYADAWFYSAYAWAPKHHLGVYGWTYFSVRFPAIMSIGVFERAFGTHDGYVFLRYVLAVCSGGAVYLVVRRFAGVATAVAACLLLYLNPFFSRMLLWDYSGFLGVAGGVVGFSLWWWSDSRSSAWALLPGAALAIAFFANPFLGTAILVLVAVDAAAALRGGRAAIAAFARRLGFAATAAVAVFVVGYLSYLEIVPSTRPDDLIRPTIKFLGSNSENSAPYQRPASEWLEHELRIWPPVILALALLAALRRRLLGSDVPARIAQAYVGYIGLLWLFRATFTSSVIETWWAYSNVVVVMAPALGVLIHELGIFRRNGRLYAALAVGASVLVALVIRNANAAAVHAYSDISERPWLIYALVALAATAAVVAGIPRSATRITGVAALTVLVTFMMWAPSVFDGRGTTGVFVKDAANEWRAYSGARKFVQLVRDYDAPGNRVYTWYPGTLGLTNIGWTTLPQEGHTVQLLGVGGPMNRLDPLGKARLLAPDASFVLVMSTRAADVGDAEHALVANGFRDQVVRQGALVAGQLRFALLRLTEKPST
jgi:hypothetical protein